VIVLPCFLTDKCRTHNIAFITILLLKCKQLIVIEVPKKHSQMYTDGQKGQMWRQKIIKK